ncbi:MAG: bifunctional [glutamate--ammonia ligase]-adenylyl-L-tyrosine phosphorylase/[glutamate--ammonia-ligase] adenylyltransferase [Burkholderiales bacterium]|nr:bifunctional [glutamate--ammonia ligase]-adenylyl-L-tyrosine phosphorylase/[glutamate--ammonia-ligase] adenylyltransferase [Burkholderiales bacterium]
MPEPIPKIDLSRAAQRMLAARPELAAELQARRPFGAEEIAAALEGAAADDEATLRRRLRRLRARVFLRTMARDLSGEADLAEVCGTMSELAEQQIRVALEWLGVPDLIVVAMGKLGGRELNVSSDIDLVFVHPTGEPPERLDRAARRLIRLLDEITEDGFAFRVDMRLRPYGNAGPLVASLDALEAYFVTQGRDWERYAWIKARPLTGADHAALEEIVRPFVYRKYLDYAMLAAMRRLHAEVRREVERRDLADDVKLGPGGIREIEFVAQVLQLIRGGRDPALAVRPTLAALAALGERRLLPAEAVRELSRAYVFLRRLEHRLQYLDDAQRHRLPAEEADRLRLARMMDCTDWAELSAQLAQHRAAVARHFGAVLGEKPDEGDLPWPEHPRAEALRASQRYAQLPADSRRRVDVIVPLLARAAQRTADPERTFARAMDLVESIARRAAYLALLAEHPQALERVARIVGASPWAAQYVARHPLVLDELLDDRVLYAAPDWEAFERALREQIAAAAGDTERQMNVLREQHQAQVFRLLAQDLAGLLTVERLADHLSDLADRVLGVALECAWREVRNRHREVPRFAVIGYGKLGGKELGYASDLDMVFLYDDPDERAEENYLRLAQRLNIWLTATTASGQLFETDLALRPSGSKGLLVSSLAGFERYQEESAWVWEHQALTRARFCAGDREIGERFEAIRARILMRARDPRALAREVRAMREKIHAAHPNRSGLFDLKHDPGGMIDIEFVVQYLVLAHAHRHPRLTGNLGNIALLAIAAELGLVDAALAERCRNAYREFRRLQHALRLAGEKYARVAPERVGAHVAAVRELWRAVFGEPRPVA